MTTTAASLTDLIATIRRLPAMTAAESQLLSLSPTDSALSEKVTRIIEADSALATHTIRVANSAAFTGQTIIDSIERAVMRVGARMVVGILVQNHVSRVFEPAPGGMSHLWMATAFSSNISMEIVARSPSLDLLPETAYMHALMHDVGRLVILAVLGSAMDALIAESPNIRTGLVRREKELFGFDHATAGRLLANHWKLPEDLSLVIGGHHAEPKSLTAFPPVVRRVIDLLRLVDELVHYQMELGMSECWQPDSLVRHIESGAVASLCKEVGVKASNVQEAIGPAIEAVGRQKDMLGISKKAATVTS